MGFDLPVRQVLEVKGSRGLRSTSHGDVRRVGSPCPRVNLLWLCCDPFDGTGGDLLRCLGAIGSKTFRTGSPA